MSDTSRTSGRRFARRECWDAPSDDQPDLLSGSNVGGFAIGARIGEGPRAFIYEGTQQNLRRPVAIKALKRRFVAQETVIERYLESARRASALLHPNVVAVYDVVSGGDLHLVVQARVEHPTLDRHIDASGPLSPETTCRIGALLCGALQDAHERDLVHGNLHPGNAFVTPDLQVLVGDFGDPGAAAFALLAARLPADSFAPPEQIRGEVPSQRSDMYWLGALLHYTCTGLAPRGGVDLGIPEPLARLLGRMMSPDVTQRPITAEAARELQTAEEELRRTAAYRPSPTVARRLAELNDPNQRLYRRLATDLPVEVRPHAADEASTLALISRLRNFSENGAFVRTDEPLPIGTVLTLRFRLETRRTPVQVLGLVRWVQQNGDETGVGVQFVEVSADSRGRFRTFVAQRMADEIVRSLTRTPLHRKLLQLIVRNWDREVPAEMLMQLTGAGKLLLRQVLPEFEQNGLVQVMRQGVRCQRPAPELATALEEALRQP